MKKIFLLLIATLAFLSTSLGQITQLEADSIVWDNMSSETQGYHVYAIENKETENKIITMSEGEELELDYPCWIYYICYPNPLLENPPSKRYLIVKKSNGNLLEVHTKEKAVPNDLHIAWRGVYLNNCDEIIMYYGRIRVLCCERIAINKNEFATMQLIPDDTCFKLRIENQTEGNLDYGEPFSLEYFNGSSWEKFDLDDVLFTTIELGVPSHGYKETSFCLPKHGSIYPYAPYSYSQGRYRIIKDFSVCYNLSPSKTDPCFYLCAEFEIE